MTTKTTSYEPITLMNVIDPASKAWLENPFLKEYSIIDWGKAMARMNEIIQKDIFKSIGIEAYDPETDDNCPNVNTSNNSPGFDIIVKKADGTLARVQSKLRQVKGKADHTQQVHFETTRRHSKKNKGKASDSGHVAYGCKEFDYVMISLVNVGKDGKDRTKRNNVDKWSFSLIPIEAITDKERGCCLTKIPSRILLEYKFDPKNPRQF